MATVQWQSICGRWMSIGVQCAKGKSIKNWMEIWKIKNSVVWKKILYDRRRKRIVVVISLEKMIDVAIFTSHCCCWKTIVSVLCANVAIEFDKEIVIVHVFNFQLWEMLAVKMCNIVVECVVCSYNLIFGFIFFCDRNYINFFKLIVFHNFVYKQIWKIIKIKYK